MVFVGIDWAEQHHDVCVLDGQGRVLVQRRVPDGVEGVRRLHELVAAAAGEDVQASQVTIGIELDRGLLVSALVAAGYRLVKIEPIATARYRDRFSSSGGKADASDARVLADAVRTDGHRHREVAGDSDLADAVRVVARVHQSTVWDRTRTIQRLRQALREYFPAALEAFPDLGHADALSVLKLAPSPEQAHRLSRSKIAAALRRGGRQLNVDRRANEIQAALRTEQLVASPAVADAFATVVGSYVTLLEVLTAEIARLETELVDRFGKHPDAAILRSFPGLGDVLGARVLGEFGDDPNRYMDAKARRNYAGTSPVTRASGQRRLVAARHVRNDRLADAIDRWAFCALTRSPGARSFYDRQRATGRTHGQALRALANKLVGMLHGCLRHRALYDEEHAWRDQPVTIAA